MSGEIVQVHDTNVFREPEYDLPTPSFPTHAEFLLLNDKMRKVVDQNAFVSDVLM